MRKQTIYERYFKRILDIGISFSIIVFLSPVIITTAILVKVKLGDPVFFVQKRPGKNEKIFNIYKFRTMTLEKHKDGTFLDDAQRLTKIGTILRKTSIDELPSLFNVLKGDMSIIGPRPLLIEYLSLYNERQKRRHAVRPGLTGLAQINGRNAISWDRKFNMDIQYIDKITFIGDLLIFVKTVKKVVFREGINSSTSATMEKFQGKEH